MTESKENIICDRCWVEWINNKPVANAGVVVINQYKKALLLQRPKTHEWVIPSGAIDKDEEPIETAIRELSEETSIKLTRNQLSFLNVFTFFHAKDSHSRDKTDISVTYVGDYIDDENKVKVDSDEAIDYRWFSENELDNIKPIHPKTLEQLREAFKKLSLKRVPNG